jgi:hypothetical protein
MMKNPNFNFTSLNRIDLSFSTFFTKPNEFDAGIFSGVVGNGTNTA